MSRCPRTVTSRIWPTVSPNQISGLSVWFVATMVVTLAIYSAAILLAPAAIAAHSAMVTLARAMGLVR